jgi:hypothetical protein
MWKPSVSIIGCLAALPLIGCAERYAALPPQSSPPPAAVYTATAPARVYATAPSAPSAILVFVRSPRFEDLLAGDPPLWAAQGLWGGDA